MTFLHAILLGIIEGLTEFLPVSSTFHLLFATQLLGLAPTDFNKLFIVVIQMGAILAVLFLYGKEVIFNSRLQKLLLYAFVPTAVVGFVLHDLIKNSFFNNNNLMLISFILVGILFLAYELVWRKRQKQTHLVLGQLSSVQAVLVGMAQSLAVIPGVSRSGAVILALLLLGFARAEAAKFSFLLALPTLTMAASYDLYKERDILTSIGDAIPLLVVGTVMAFISAVLILKAFIRYISHKTFVPFGIYRVVVGIGLLILMSYID